MKWILLYIELTAALLCGCAYETNAANRPGDDPEEIFIVEVPPVPAPPVPAPPVGNCQCKHPCKCPSTPGNKACKCIKCRCDKTALNPKPSPKCDCDFCRCKGVCECGYEVQVKAAPIKTYFEFHTSSACGVCQQWKADVLPALQAAGWKVGPWSHIRIVEHATIDESLPKFVFVRAGQRLGSHVGYLEADKIAARLSTPPAGKPAAKPASAPVVEAGYQWPNGVIQGCACDFCKANSGVNNSGGNWLRVSAPQGYQSCGPGGNCR